MSFNTRAPFPGGTLLALILALALSACSDHSGRHHSQAADMAANGGVDDNGNPKTDAVASADGGDAGQGAPSGPIDIQQISWTPFTESSEHAYTAQVPAGWKVDGGVVRSSPDVAKPWLTAATPDGATLLYLGDPTLPLLFTEPGQYGNGPEGTEIQSAIATMTIMSYRSATQFAKLYGAHTLPDKCANPKLETAEDRPDLAEAARAHAGGDVQLESGMALFSCQVGGRPYESAIYLTTSRYRGGLWSVGVMGLRTPQGQVPQAEQVLLRLSAREHTTPEWNARMAQAAAQAGAEAREVTARSWDSFGQRMRAQEQQTAETLQSGHDRYMAASTAAADARNQRFAQHEYDKSIQNRDFILMVKGHHLERDRETGRLYEVPD